MTLVVLVIVIALKAVRAMLEPAVREITSAIEEVQHTTGTTLDPRSANDLCASLAKKANNWKAYWSRDTCGSSLNDGLAGTGADVDRRCLAGCEASQRRTARCMHLQIDRRTGRAASLIQKNSLSKNRLPSSLKGRLNREEQAAQFSIRASRR